MTTGRINQVAPFYTLSGAEPRWTDGVGDTSKKTYLPAAAISRSFKKSLARGAEYTNPCQLSLIPNLVGFK